MRMMLRISVPTEDGNRAIKDGSLPKTLEKALADLTPEAAYFTADCGRRTAYMFIDMADVSDMPSIAEPFFLNFNASVDFIPVMNAAELRKGLPRAMEAITT